MSFPRRKNLQRAATVRAVVATATALVCHGLLGVVLVASGALDPGKTLPFSSTNLQMETETESLGPPIEISQIVTDLVANLDTPDQPTPEEEARKREEEKTKIDGQVVDIAKPTLEMRPDEARFLAEYDSKVQKETKGQRGKELAGTPNPPVPPAPLRAPPVLPQPPAPQVKTDKTKVPNLEEASSEVSPKEVGPDGYLAPRMGRVQMGQKGQTGKATPNLLSPDLLQRALGLPAGPVPPTPPSPQAGQGAGSMDHLADVDDGDGTSLNAKKWKFASFFNRLKRAVGDEWHPDTVYLRHDPSGNIYGVRDRVTTLRVSLTPAGKVAGIQILKPSGVDFLDDEAVAAFKRAQPFMNPPPQLVEADGQIHFNFAFIFELSGKASFKVFRY